MDVASVSKAAARARVMQNRPWNDVALKRLTTHENHIGTKRCFLETRPYASGDAKIIKARLDSAGE